jgi:hypothetical protein
MKGWNPRVAVFANDTMLRDRIKRVAEGVADVEFVYELPRAGDQRGDVLPTVLVVELQDTTVPDVRRWYEETRHRVSPPTLLLYVTLEPQTIWKALELARAKCGQAIVHGQDELQRTLLDAINRAIDLQAALALLENAGLPPNAVFCEIVRYCHVVDVCPFTVDALASGLETTMRTLERRAKGEGLGSPLVLFTWSKLLRSARAYDRGDGEEMVAARGAFSDFEAFATKFKEYVATSLQMVPDGSSGDMVRAAISGALKRPEPEPRVGRLTPESVRAVISARGHEPAEERAVQTGTNVVHE